MRLAHNPEAEQGALGGMLLSSSAVAEVLEIVRAEDFYNPRHESVFAAIVALYGQGEPHDVIAVAAELMRRGDLERVGGAPYLHTLMSSVPVAANAGYYARIVAEMAKLRRFQSAAVRIMQMADQTAVEDVDAILAAAYQQLDTVSTDRETRWEEADDVLERVLEDVKDPREHTGLQSGLVDLDAFWRGIPEGEVCVVGARASVGKSLFAVNFIRHNTLANGVPTMLFTLEMSAEQYMRRILSAETEVALDRLVNPLLNPLGDRDWFRIAQVSELIAQMPLKIVDDSGLSLADIARYVREEARKGLKLAIVDFQQLMQWPDGVKAEHDAVGLNAYGLKKLARSTGVRILDLVQLNREPTRRANQTPVPSDIAGSMKVEQAGHSIILIDRPDMRDEGDHPGEAAMIVGKQRDGRTGPAWVSFRGHYAKFSNLAPEGM